jgi:hypothetical protein
MSRVLDPTTRLTPPAVTRFLLFLLANNDNSKNQVPRSHCLQPALALCLYIILIDDM